MSFCLAPTGAPLGLLSRPGCFCLGKRRDGPLTVGPGWVGVSPVVCRSLSCPLAKAEKRAVATHENRFACGFLRPPRWCGVMSGQSWQWGCHVPSLPPWLGSPLAGVFSASHFAAVVFEAEGKETWAGGPRRRAWPASETLAQEAWRPSTQPGGHSSLATPLRAGAGPGRRLEKDFFGEDDERGLAASFWPGVTRQGQPCLASGT